jgi:hypothetical protein
MTRWKAAAIHSLISVAVGLIAGALLLCLWYPPPYFHAAGADELILLLVGVDLVIGPLLTLIVFRPGKRGLAFDLTVIAVLQAAALVYGLAIVLQSRPVFLVATVDRFVLVAANEITDEDLAAGSEEAFRTRSWTGPRLAAAELPTDPEQRNKLLDLTLAGRDLQNLPRYYRPYASDKNNLLARAKPLAQLRQSAKDLGPLNDWLSAGHRKEDAIVWLPLQARKEDLVMLLDARTAEPLGALAIDPW